MKELLPTEAALVVCLGCLSGNFPLRSHDHFLGFLDLFYESYLLAGRDRELLLVVVSREFSI